MHSILDHTDPASTDSTVDLARLLESGFMSLQKLLVTIALALPVMSCDLRSHSDRVVTVENSTTSSISVRYLSGETVIEPKRSEEFSISRIEVCLLIETSDEVAQYAIVMPAAFLEESKLPSYPHQARFLEDQSLVTDTIEGQPFYYEKFLHYCPEPQEYYTELHKRIDDTNE